MPGVEDGLLVTGFDVTAAITDYDGAPITLKVIVAVGVTETGGAVDGSVIYGTPTVSLTPAESGSLILFGLYNGSSSTLFTAAEGSVLLDSATAGTLAFADGYYEGTVTEGTPATVGAEAFLAWEAIGAVELPASGDPAIDSSTPAPATAAAATVTSPTFAPPTYAVLAAFLLFQAEGPSDCTIVDSSGLGMAWTQRLSYQSTYEGAVVAWTTTVPQILANDQGALASACVI
jgi:hypothetical protein